MYTRNDVYICRAQYTIYTKGTDTSHTHGGNIYRNKPYIRKDIYTMYIHTRRGHTHEGYTQMDMHTTYTRRGHTHNGILTRSEGYTYNI